MTDLTPEQRIALSAIDAAGNIAEAAQAIAHALTEAASVLRQITSPYGSEPCHGDCGWPPDEDLVEGEVPEEQAEDRPQDTTARFRAFVARQNAAKPELPIERPLDVERSDAGFTSGPIWVGGPGVYDGPHIYWSEVDLGITHDMLMDACEGLSLEGRREAHIRAGASGQTVTDLYNALLERKRVEMAAYASTFAPALERAYTAEGIPVAEALEGTPPTTGPSSCGISWDEAGEPATAEETASEQLFRILDTFDRIAAEQPQDGPNFAELPLSADVSETGCAASPAAPGGNPEDWRWVNPPETELAGDAHEWDALTKHLEDPRPSPAGPGQSNSTFSGKIPAVAIDKPIMD